MFTKIRARRKYKIPQYRMYSIRNAYYVAEAQQEQRSRETCCVSSKIFSRLRYKQGKFSLYDRLNRSISPLLYDKSIFQHLLDCVLDLDWKI